MGAHMKTTVEISDALFQRAKHLAAQRHTTFKTIVEAALREFLAAPRSNAGRPFRLRKHTFGGRGLRPGLDESDWATIRERAYEGRGG